MVKNMVAMVPASAVVRAHPLSPKNQRTVHHKIDCDDSYSKRQLHATRQAGRIDDRHDVSIDETAREG